MKLWKRNAVVAAIVLFVCVAVYLNWSYNQESADTGKVLGQAALVGGQTTDPLLSGGSGETGTPAPSASPAPSGEQTESGLFRLRPAQPAGGPGQRTDHPSGVGGERDGGRDHEGIHDGGH